MIDLKELSIENKIKARNFFNSYELENVLTIPDKKTFLGNKKERICKFCKRTSPEVKFHNKAHLFPSFMDNDKLFSYFECDTCNEQFSLYEDSLAKFIGPSRTIMKIGTKDQRQIPKFKNQYTGCSIEVNEMGGLKIFTFADTNEFSINKRKRTAFLSTLKQPYIPLYVFKCLTKLSLCLISERELINFEQTARFLINKDSEKDKLIDADHRFRVIHYLFDHYDLNLKTSAFLFSKHKKKKPLLVPEKTLVVYFGTHIFQIMIPFNVKDNILERKKFYYPIFPFLVKNKLIKKYGECFFNVYDMSFKEKYYNDRYKFKFSFE